MLSMPPATTMSASPRRIDWAASATAFRPEPHALFTPKTGTSFGSPPSSSATRDGFSPSPAESTLPRITSSTRDGSELRGRLLRERAAEGADRGPRRRDDDGFGHDEILLRAGGGTTARRRRNAAGKARDPSTAPCAYAIRQRQVRDGHRAALVM